MKSKKFISVTGNLLFPLNEGRRAIIMQDSGYVVTSRVVEVIEVAPDHAVFETMNSIYRVAFERSPNKASLKMCA